MVASIHRHAPWKRGDSDSRSGSTWPATRGKNCSRATSERRAPQCPGVRGREGRWRVVRTRSRRAGTDGTCRRSGGDKMRREIETEPEIDTLGHQWDKEDGALTTAIAEPSLVIRSIEDLKPMSAFGGSEVVMVVDGMLAEGRIALVTGEPGDGKTTLVSDIIYRVSRGALFAGRPTSQRPVLVLDKENPRTSLLAMYERLGISEHEEYRVWGDWQPDEPPAPDSPVILDWISRCHRKPLILVDSLIAFGGGDENNAAET